VFDVTELNLRYRHQAELAERMNAGGHRHGAADAAPRLLAARGLLVRLQTRRARRVVPADPALGSALRARG